MTSIGTSWTRAVCLLLALLLGERTTAIRLDADEADILIEHDDGLDAANPVTAQPVQLPKITKAVEEAKEIQGKLTCGEITSRIFDATAQVSEAFKAVCGEGECDFTRLTVDEMLPHQGLVASLVGAADGMKCLDRVMGDEQVQQQLVEMLSFVPKLWHAAPTEEGSQRVKEAYLQLVTWQKGILALEDDLADRKALIDYSWRDRVESACPKPCKRCDLHKSSSFGFRCLLDKGEQDLEPQGVGGGVTCSEPRKRFLRRWREKQCEVNDWKETALQHLHVSAMMSCASLTMLMGVNGWISQSRRQELHELCLKTEQGNFLSEEEEADYQVQMEVNDDVVPQGFKLALNTVLVYGLSSGVAGLRAATRDNGRIMSLLEGGSGALRSRGFYEPYALVLATEEPALEVRDLDKEMYGNKGLHNRAETQNKLEKCEELYNVKSQNTMAEGFAPILLMSMNMWSSDHAGVMSTGDDVDAPTPSPAPISWSSPLLWLNLLLTAWWGTILAFFMIQLVAVLFFIPQLIFTGVWLDLISWAVMGYSALDSYRFFFQVFAALGLRSSVSEERLDQCFQAGAADEP